MSTPLDARIIFLMFYPYTPPVVPKGSVIHPLQPSQTQRTPYFLNLDIELVELGQSEIQLSGQSVLIHRQLIDEQIICVECAYRLNDILAADGNERKQLIQTQLHEKILRDAEYTGQFFEEYSIVCIGSVQNAPDAFIDTHRHRLAALLRNLRRPVSDTDVEQILVSRAHYTDRDVTLVDWEGALIIDPDQDFQSDIDLIKIGNYELLRYRLLDRAIERNLQAVRTALESKRKFNFFNNLLREALQQRLELLLNFEKTEQLLLLIGDWYSAQLYRIIVDEFYIDEWKTTVKSKLDQLETITDIIRDNFTLSWEQTLDMIQLIGWLILLAGYFVLFYLDVVAAAR
jgi:hypothetical protein